MKIGSVSTECHGVLHYHNFQHSMTQLISKNVMLEMCNTEITEYIKHFSSLHSMLIQFSLQLKAVEEGGLQSDCDLPSTPNTYCQPMHDFNSHLQCSLSSSVFEINPPMGNIYGGVLTWIRLQRIHVTKSEFPQNTPNLRAMQFFDPFTSLQSRH